MKQILFLAAFFFAVSLAAQQGAGQTVSENGAVGSDDGVGALGQMEQPAEFDPNFHVYLCLGQSNMEGVGRIEDEDMRGVDSRFCMMAAVDMPRHGRKQGEWYVAYPPLCREHTGLTPADYFGRTMVANLPDSVRVGVIDVAVGGCRIELFEEEKAAEYIAAAPDWLQRSCAEYGDNPFRRLVECAKRAQKVGVIKGILVHQGCSNNGEADWGEKVKVVYERLLAELGLSAVDTPLLLGELLQRDEGGACWHHNAVIARTPSLIPNAYVVSSAKCTGMPDHLHFTSEGYRLLGTRYAMKMLPLVMPMVEKR